MPFIYPGYRPTIHTPKGRRARFLCHREPQRDKNTNVPAGLHFASESAKIRAQQITTNYQSGAKKRLHL